MNVYNRRSRTLLPSGAYLPLLSQVLDHLEGEYDHTPKQGQQEHHHVFFKGSLIGLSSPGLGLLGELSYRRRQYRFFCLGSCEVRGLLRSTWSGDRMERQRWITHGPTSGDREDGVPGQEELPVGGLQTIQRNHDATLASKPCNWSPGSPLNSDGKQSIGLRTSCKQDIHGDLWKPGCSKG